MSKRVSKPFNHTAIVTKLINEDFLSFESELVGVNVMFVDHTAIWCLKAEKQKNAFSEEASQHVATWYLQTEWAFLTA